MEEIKTHSFSDLTSKVAGRLYRALPAVVLGTLFNVLDTGMGTHFCSSIACCHSPILNFYLVSTGLLLFPSEEGTGPTQFKALQIQGLSMYIMRCVTRLHMFFAFNLMFLFLKHYIVAGSHDFGRLSLSGCLRRDAD